jgi:hypothetical protein
MSEITVQASSSPITVSATAGTVSATVAASSVSTTTTGGVGPQGPQGIQGPPGDALGAAEDVQLVGVNDGDVLTYSADVGAWINAEAIDGGNW